MKPKSAISRRRFLKGTVGAAIGFPYVVSSSALAQGASAPSNRLVGACIGVHGMGNNHLRTILGRKDVQVAAICDVDKSVRDRAIAQVVKKYSSEQKGDYAGCAGYNDFRELLARDDVDFITCGTPDHWHVPIAVAAAKAGKDMYVEKPLTLTIHEGLVLCDTIRRYGRVLQVGTQHRSTTRFRYACELVRNGRIGKLHTIKVGLPNARVCPPQPEMPVPPGFDYDMWLGQAPWAPYTELRCHYNFRFIRDYSGGQITNFGAHYVDIAQWANGTQLTGPVEVEGKGTYPREGLYNVVQDFRFNCKYENGVRLTCSNHEKGAVHFEGSEGWLYASPWLLAANPPSILKSKIGANEIHLYKSDSHWGNFIDCIRTRKDPIAAVEIGHRTVSVCHLGNIAMELGRKVRWDPDKQNFANDPEAERMLTRAMRPPWRV